ncbi:hypothetical protein PLCT2_02226 [Planctomycetaceae bacterium]|nr:hypothetical protein PLCT2_02226 [Planctomycetaceae bacterium]
MKKFALLLVVVAFGASFIVGCPGNKPANTAGNAAPAANDANAPAANK